VLKKSDDRESMQSFCYSPLKSIAPKATDGHSNAVRRIVRFAQSAATSSLTYCLFIAVGSSSMSPLLSIRAEEPPCDAVTVSVRTIEASGALDASMPPGEMPPATVDPALEDLVSKLSQLPFRSFRLVAAKDEQLSLRKKEVMHLPNDQTLAFRPMYMDSKRVGLWLSWKDSSGGSILDTRIHFDANESILTGTDCSPDTGTILAIKALPAPHRNQ
jgi:hypothetical protein